MKIGSFVMDLVSVFDDTGTRQAIASFAKISTAGFAINKGLESITQKFADMSVSTKILGDDFQNLQKWMNAGASSAFTNFDKTKNAIQNLQNQLIQARQTGQIPVGFQLAGVNVNQSASQVLESLQKTISGASPLQGARIAEFAGVKDLLPLLQQSKSELEKFNKIPILSSAQLNSIFDATTSLRTLKTSIVAIKDQVFAALAPAMKEMLEMLANGLLTVMPLVIEGIRRLGAGMAQVLRVFKEFKIVGVIAVGGIFQMLGGFKLLHAAALSILKPFNLIKAHPLFLVLAGLGLILEDIYSWTKGYDSVFGTLLQKFPNAQKLIMSCATALISGLTLAGVYMSAGFIPKIVSSIAFIGKMTGVTKILQLALLAFTKMTPFGLIITAISALSAGAVALYKNFDKVKEVIGSVWDKITNLKNSLFGEVKVNNTQQSAVQGENYDVGQTIRSIPINMPQQANNKTNNNTTNNNKTEIRFGDIKINGGSNSTETANNLTKEISRMMQNASFGSIG